MLDTKYISSFIFSLALSTSLNTTAQVTKDVIGSTDNIFIGRYPGSYISHFYQTDFDKVIIPLTVNSLNKPKKFDSLPVEGERTIIIYDLPPANEKNIYKVYKSLEKSFLAKGFEPTLNCNTEENKNSCGSFFTRQIFKSSVSHKNYRKFKEFYNLNHNDGPLYIYSGKLEKDNGEYYLTSVISKSKYSRYIQYSIDMVKVGELETKAMVLTTNDLTSGINSHGKAELKGIYFDNDSATLNKKSEASLTTIATYLKAHPNSKYYVVGHTDTKGSYSYNQQLSQNRAKAVMASLVAKGVSKEALRADGISYLSPVESNSKNEGKEKNRRVELIEVQEF